MTGDKRRLGWFALAGGAFLATIAADTALPLPWPAVFAGLATLIATSYLIALWWLERRDEA